MARGFNLQTQLRWIAVRAADLELLDLEFALEFDNCVEDAFHDMAINEMALRFNDFRNGSVPVTHVLLFRITSGPPSTRERVLVGRHVFPIGYEIAQYLAAMAAEQFLQFPAMEPLLPGRSFEPPPMFRVLVDDHNPSPRTNHPAHLGDGSSRYRSHVQEIQSHRPRRSNHRGREARSSRSHSKAQFRWVSLKHSLGQIERCDAGLRIVLFQYPGKSALATADVKYAPIAKISEKTQIN